MRRRVALLVVLAAAVAALAEPHGPITDRYGGVFRSRNATLQREFTDLLRELDLVVQQQEGGPRNASGLVDHAPVADAPASQKNATSSSNASHARPFDDRARIPASYAELIKSRGDARSYRRTVLPNGLDVLLVSDNRSAMVAAAMDVNCGWWNDPRDIPGLSHFLEHMLFLGNKQHPRLGEWRGFLARHGGRSNAFTSGEHTNFYFLTSGSALTAALERFSAFFKSPTFNIDGTSKEMKAVDAENVKNLQDDGWRLTMLLQSLSNASLPFHHFSTGNRKTLGEHSPEELHRALLVHWAKHYVSTNMRLVIVANRNLNELEALVLKYFATVQRPAPTSPPTRLKPRRRFDGVRDQSRELFAGRPSTVIVQSVKRQLQLLLVFPLPPQMRHYARKSLQYLNNMILTSSPGSLRSYLRAKGLINGMGAGTRVETAAFDLYQVRFELTAKGATRTEIKGIIADFFSWVRFIETSGVDEWRWREMLSLSAMEFRLKKKEPMASYASSLAEAISRYEPRDVLVGKYLFLHFNASEIRGLCGRLLPEQPFKVVNSSQHHAGGLSDFTDTEPYYGTRYTVDEMTVAQLKVLAFARQNACPEFRLPGPNPFVKQNLRIMPPAHADLPLFPTHPYIAKSFEANATQQAAAAGGGGEKPGSVRVWFKQDTKFRRPRANVLCKFWSGVTYGSPRQIVLAALYAALVRDATVEELYQSRVAGFSFVFTADTDGFNVRMAGYNSGMKAFVRRASRSLVGDKFTRERFKVVRSALNETYGNLQYKQPHDAAAYAAFFLLENPHWHVSQYEAALQYVTFEDMAAFARSFYQDTALECLVAGNVLEKEAVELVDAISAAVDHHSVSQTDFARSKQPMRITQLDGSYVFQMAPQNEHDTNSAVFTYYQYEGEGNWNDDVFVQLLAALMSKPAFHQLRTKEQLGYLVWTGMFNLNGVNGIRLVVQSPRKSAAYVDECITHFMYQLRATLRNMTHAHFEAVVQGAIHSKRLVSPTLPGDMERWWSEIKTQQYRFDRHQKEIDTLRGFTLPQLLRAFDDLIGFNSVPSRLSVHVDHRLAATDQQQSQSQSQSLAGPPGGSSSERKQEHSKEQRQRRRRGDDELGADAETEAERFLQLDSLAVEPLVNDPARPPLALVEDAEMVMAEPEQTSVSLPDPKAPLLVVQEKASADGHEHNATKYTPVLPPPEAPLSRDLGPRKRVSCDHQGPRVAHPPAWLKPEDIAHFNKQHLCLFPRQFVNPVLPTKARMAELLAALREARRRSQILKSRVAKSTRLVRDKTHHQ